MIDANLVAKARDADLVATAEALGARLKRASATELVGPCPRCGGTDRFSVNRKQQVWHCRGCAKGGGDAISLVSHVRELNFRQVIAFLTGEATHEPARPKPTAAPTTDNGDYGEKALALWHEGVDPRPTVVTLYLNLRALDLGDDLAGEVLRWHPRIGAMLGLFRNIITGEPQAISRTYIDREGAKVERKFLGPVMGAAVMLDRFDDVLGGLHVGEGIETCMAARQLGLRPCWALGSAPAVAAFPVLGGIECLTPLQENDDVSKRACEACAARWHAAGCEVFINQPTAGKDLNDAMRGTP